MSNRTTRIWSPIEDLPESWRQSLNTDDVAAVVAAWHEQAEELKEQKLYDEFLARLRREWAIETGILERLYTLEEGATKTLIEKGLDASLISHEDTDQSPGDVMAKIRDQHDAIEGLYHFIGDQRPLGTSYIKELHAVLTEHQPTFTARDTLGNIVERDLVRGDWKKSNNDVEGPDGYRFEFCPYEHVPQEMDRLLEMHEQHTRDGVPPDIEAAWLHHRFALIHPFTDGNGRVARCLATLVLLKENWFPLVVTRRERERYLTALREADKGDLRPLVDLVGMLQKRAIREARDLQAHVIDESQSLGDILSSVTATLDKRQNERETLMKQAVTVADALHATVQQHLEKIASDVDAAIGPKGREYKAYVHAAGPDDDKAHYYRYQIAQCAKQLDYYANFQVYQAWAALVVMTETRTEILFSFHGVGWESAGVLGCAGMVFTKYTDDENKQTETGNLTPLSDEPFEFSYREDLESVRTRFRAWFERAALKGLEHWRRFA